MAADADAPSPFVVAECERILAAARLGPLLDLACGRGRHALAAASWGVPVIALDRDAEAVDALAAEARDRSLRVAALRADAETPLGLPLRPACFGVVLVSRFLHRPLAPALAALLAPGGLLVYETFTSRQRELGQGPTRDAFLLEPGELPRLFPALRVERYDESLRTGTVRPEWLASLAARRPAAHEGGGAA